MTAPRDPEHRLQVAVVQLLRMAAAPGVTWYAVPNGGARSVTTGARLKAEGVRPGVADLAFVINGRAHFLELKAGTHQSREQRHFEADATSAGAVYRIAFSFVEAADILAEWGAIRARVAA